MFVSGRRRRSLDTDGMLTDETNVTSDLLAFSVVYGVILAALDAKDIHTFSTIKGEVNC